MRRDGRTVQSWPWLAAGAGVVLGVGGLVHAMLTTPTLSLASVAAQSFLLLAFLGAGAILISRRPDHRVSWLVPLPGLYLVLDEGLDLVVYLLALGERSELWLDWFSALSFAYTFPPAAIFLPLLFPTGRVATPRWRWVLWTGSVSIVCLTVGNAIAPDLLEPRVNPAAVSDTAAQVFLIPGALLLVVSFVAAGISAVRRYRVAVRLERQQLRWFVRAAALVPVGWSAGILTEGTEYQQIGGLILGLTLSMLPVAVTVAVLRYRLYDIDRVVSRTLSYAVVTAVLAGVYAFGVLGVGAVVPVGSSDLVVAGSTLAVAALFQPLRARVQAFVDQRFSRARYDAQRTVAAFGVRLRDQVDLDGVTEDLAAVLDGTVAPRHASLWLPEAAT